MQTCFCGRDAIDVGDGDRCARCVATDAIGTLRTWRGGVIRGSDLDNALALAINTLDGSLEEDWIPEAIERAYQEARR